jgi:hypothetical protein
MRLLATILAAFILLPFPSAALAETDLTQALARLGQAIEGEQNLSPEFKRALSDVVSALEEEEVRTSASVAAANPKSFLDRFHPSADLRLRHEWDGRRGAENRNRERMRLRLGATVDIGEGLLAGFRLRSGDPRDAQSPYHDFGRSDGRWMLGSADVNIDLAYLSYKPKFLEGSFLTGGKFKHPFARTPVYGELVWDADVNPEGLAAGYTTTLNEDLQLSLVLGEYQLIGDDAGPTGNHTNDTFSVFVTQATADIRLSDTSKLMAALGWYNYSDPEPDGTTLAVAQNAGNMLQGTGLPAPLDFEYVSDFSILNPVLALTTEFAGMPLKFSGEYILNTQARGAADDRDTGYALGVWLGRSGWSGFYQWQVIEQDAVFSPFAQDDFQQSTNFRGHVLGLNYKLTDHLGARAWGLISKQIRGGPSHYGSRLRFDLTASF